MFKRRWSLSLAAILMVFCLASTLEAKVSVTLGPTPIPNGEATNPADITVQNDKFAISIAAATPGPWGAPQGGIMDGGVILPDGKIDINRLAWVDFLPDNWSEWVPSYYKVEVAKDTPQEAVVTAERDWQGLLVENAYTVRDGDDKVHLKTKFTNTTGQEVKDIYSGFCLWNSGGYPLPLVGTAEPASTGMVPAEGAMADWFVNYDETWGVALHAPYVTHINYQGKDMHRQVNLKPGESLEFEGWLQMLPDGGLSPVLDWEMARKKITPGVITGAVSTTAGEKVAEPVVVVKKNGQTYVWTKGKNAAYELRLPEGEYELYATGKNYGPGQTVKVAVKAGKKQTLNFADVEIPATVNVSVTAKADGRPLDAILRIESGYTPEVRYLGQKVFFTDLEKIGQAELPLAAGQYEISVNYGAGFLASPAKLSLNLKPSEKTARQVALETTYRPSAKAWYSADMHHHSDILDGNTPPETVALSQTARGLDLILLSDHDSAANHARAAKVAASRQKPFIPAIEISPSWSHFNALGLPLGQELANPNNLTVQEIFADARKNGAQLIMVNHPFNNFGYYKAVAENRAPGGYYDAYDLVEINSYYLKKHSPLVMERMYEKWNKGLKVYIASGTDSHDLWAETHPGVRTVARVEGELTGDKFLASLKAGHSYVSVGPIVYPEKMFGEEAKVKAGQTISFTVESATPFTKARFMHNGQEVQSQEFDPPASKAELKFKAPAKPDGWVNLEIEGPDYGLLWTNPVWLKAAP